MMVRAGFRASRAKSVVGQFKSGTFPLSHPISP